MAAKERIFFAGVGITFAILAIGFGGGLLIASSAMKDTATQKRVSSEPMPAARVVHPALAEPALQITAAAPTESADAPPGPVPAPQPLLPAMEGKETQVLPRDKSAERAEQRRAGSAER